MLTLSLRPRNHPPKARHPPMPGVLPSPISALHSSVDLPPRDHKPESRPWHPPPTIPANNDVRQGLLATAKSPLPPPPLLFLLPWIAPLARLSNPHLALPQAKAKNLLKPAFSTSNHTSLLPSFPPRPPSYILSRGSRSSREAATALEFRRNVEVCVVPLLLFIPFLACPRCGQAAALHYIYARQTALCQPLPSPPFLFVFFSLPLPSVTLSRGLLHFLPWLAPDNESWFQMSNFLKFPNRIALCE